MVVPERDPVGAGELGEWGSVRSAGGEDERVVGPFGHLEGGGVVGVVPADVTDESAVLWPGAAGRARRSGARPPVRLV